MASYDKLIKYLVEKFQSALAPLDQIAKNQSIMIAQNKQIIELLAQQTGNRQPETEQPASPVPPSTDDEPSPTE